MKFEFVEFYRNQNTIKRRKDSVNIGTVHIYFVDYAMDLRGIVVFIRKNYMHFKMPHFRGIDPDTGETVWYPAVSFTTHIMLPDLLKFLIQEVQPQIWERLKAEMGESLPKLNDGS